MLYHYTPTRMANMEQIEDTSIDEEMEYKSEAYVYHVISHSPPRNCDNKKAYDEEK